MSLFGHRKTKGNEKGEREVYSEPSCMENLRQYFEGMERGSRVTHDENPETASKAVKRNVLSRYGRERGKELSSFTTC